MRSDRYSRQSIFAGLGAEGQSKLSRARVAVIGLGALGTVIANNLCRAGIGFLRLVDRDYVEISNLQRQMLFTEEDAKEELPKAVAAGRHLAAVNSETVVEPLVADVNSGSVMALLSDVDLVLDGTDNFETRYLINEACHKLSLPWIYGGALAAEGGTMNILPEGPCFRCLSPEVPAPGSYQTCGTAGVLNMITGAVASLESAEAVKILTGSPAVSRAYFSLDIWRNTARYVEIARDPDCPVCARGEYEFLFRRQGSYSAALCGREAVQIAPPAGTKVDLPRLAEGLRQIGAVRLSPYMLSFTGGVAFNLFPDGRAIIKNARDEAAALSVYAEYIGL
ncbi:MAG: ThiF family adenylyltransferase [Gracilibacteraceae bacterium]|nr:ThiF family adenylyltransferase [Gracilibacteraceae bacterium]